MARTTSETTYKKIDFVRDLLKKESPTQREIRQRVHKKFGTGLSFKHIASLCRGEDPLEATPRKRKKKARAVNGVAKKQGRATRKKGGRRKALTTILAEAPRFVISVPNASFVTGVDSKSQVKNEIARLLEDGIEPEDISVYCQEAFDVTVRHQVSF